MKGKVFLNFSNLTRSGQKKKNLIELVSYMISPTVAEMKCNQLLLLEIKFQGCGTKELFLLSYCSFACLSFFALFLCLFSRAFFKECRRNILYDEYDVHSFPVSLKLVSWSALRLLHNQPSRAIGAFTRFVPEPFRFLCDFCFQCSDWSLVIQIKIPRNLREFPDDLLG